MKYFKTHTEFVNEGKFDKKKLMKAMKKDDGMIQLSNGKEYVIYNPDSGNDDNTNMWQDKVIFGLDQDGEEHEIRYSDIVSYNESRKINLKQDHLSPAEYQMAKKLKDFSKDDWRWNNKTDLYDKVNEINTSMISGTRVNNCVPKDESEVNEAEDYKYKKYVTQAFDKISDEMFAFRNAMGVKQLGQADPKLKKRIEAMQAEIFALRRDMKSEGLTESEVNEAIDIKYWSDYNTDTSGQGKKEHEEKSKDFEDTFEDAVVYWNQEADGAENRIKGAQIQKIKKMAQEFFKKAGWISSNVIQAMIAQESLLSEGKSYQEKFKEEDATYQEMINDPSKRVYDIVDFAQFTTGGMTQRQWEMFMYGRYKKDLQSTDSKIKEKMYKVLNKWLGESIVTEGKFDSIDVKDLHFEIDPKTAEEMKIELGKRQGEVVVRKQIQGGEYSLRRFRKEIKYDTTGKDLGVFRPGSYMSAISTLGDGPHKKTVKAKRWNQTLYDKWLADISHDNDGMGQDSSFGFEMAQNAKQEPGLIDWVKKNNRGEDPLQRIQWDIEASM